MTDYIITEEQLLDTKSYIYHEDEVAFERIYRAVHSNPYNPIPMPELSEEYIIKEEELAGMIYNFYNGFFSDGSDIAAIVRSHPYKSEWGDCNSMGCCEFCHKDGCWYLSAICKKKRDKLLDNLEKVLREYENVRFVDVVCEIDKLRHEGES